MVGRVVAKNKDSIFDDLSKEAGSILSANLVDKLLKESEIVVGDLGENLLKSDAPIDEKLAHLQSLEQIALAEQLKAFSENTLDTTQLLASKGLLAIVRTLKTTINQRHKLNKDAKVDFKDPKISMAFGFFLELMVKTVTEVGVDDDTLLKIMDTMSIATTDFENKLDSTFDGLDSSDITKVENPFLTKNTVEELDFIPLYDVIDAEVEEVKPKPKPKRRRKKKTPTKKPVRKRRAKKKAEDV